MSQIYVAGIFGCVLALIVIGTYYLVRRFLEWALDVVLPYLRFKGSANYVEDHIQEWLDEAIEELTDDWVELVEYYWQDEDDEGSSS